jgi:multimeric flavodoxin WrbA
VRALVLNCTLKKSPAESNTQALAETVIAELEHRDVKVDTVRVVDQRIPFGVETDLGDGDEWPALHSQILRSDILIVATPTWLGQPSSVAKLVLERMDAIISERPTTAHRSPTTRSPASS